MTTPLNEAAERLFDVIDVRTALEPRAKTAIKNSIRALQRDERRATVERIIKGLEARGWNPVERDGPESDYEMSSRMAMDIETVLDQEASR